MSFTTACFVRIKDEKERKKVIQQLEELGYKVLKETIYGRPYLMAVNGDVQGVFIQRNGYALNAFYCNENIPLFLALAALRNDSDKHQWFVDSNNRWLFCERENINEFIDMAYIHGYDVSDLRKATVEELVEHFKKNKQ